MPEHDVLVVGGGPAGASTAYFLARAGARVMILDRARFPRDKPCAEYLSPQASRLLDAMRIEARIEEAGASRLRGMIVRAPDGATLRGDFAASHGFRGYRDRGLAIRRIVLDAILLNAARDSGARVMEGARVVSLCRDARGRVKGVEALLRSGSVTSLGAPVVVGADGLNSVIAARAGLTHRAPWPERIALVTHFTGVDGVSDRGEMHVERDSYLGIARVDCSLVNVALVVSRRAARSIRGDPRQYLLHWIAQRPHLASRFGSAQIDGRIFATGPFARRAHRAWAPGVALVGDAADFFDPFTGEGIYTALRGGELLAGHLLEYCGNGLSDESLRLYNAARRREFGGKFVVERIVGAVISIPGVMNRLTATLGRKKDMADLLVGVTGDFVPARELLRARYVLGLLS